MKLLCLILLLCFLPSCQFFRDLAKDEARKFWNEEAKPVIEEKITAKLNEKAPQLVAQLDTNKNGRVELDEIKGLNVKDPQLWLTVMNLIGTLLVANGSKKRDDQLWDSHADTKVAMATSGVPVRGFSGNSS
jgi:hypothetical protein